MKALLCAILIIPTGLGAFGLKFWHKPVKIEQCHDLVLETPDRCPAGTRAAAVWSGASGKDYVLCLCSDARQVVKW